MRFEPPRNAARLALMSGLFLLLIVAYAWCDAAHPGIGVVYNKLANVFGMMRWRELLHQEAEGQQSRLLLPIHPQTQS